jgi:carbon-monoxide dehydrogenase medium subunit
MKPHPFDYVAPETLDEALDLLARVGDDAVIIAGGQSLVPILNLRLARPELVICPTRCQQRDLSSRVHACRGGQRSSRE